MHVIGAIFRRDLLRILRNPFALVVTLGVAVIPSLYAWFNIIANWDPYSNTGNIQVAVANADQGADSALAGHLDIGSQVVGQLRANHQLGWTFVDEPQAIDGTAAGDYYAAIVIPADFSQNLADALNGGTKRPTLDYYVNEKKNAIAPKITDTGANTLEEQINHEFTATVGSVVAQKGGELLGDATGRADTARKDALGDVASASKAIRDAQGSLGDLDGTIATTRKAATDAKDALGGLATAAGDATASLTDAEGLLSTTRSTAGAFAGTAGGTAGQGLTQLGQVSSQASGQLGTLAGGIVSAQSKADAALAEAGKLADANRSLADALGQVSGKLPDGDAKTTVDAAVTQLNAQAGVIDGVTSGLGTGGKDLAGASQTLASASSTIDDAIRQGTSSLGDLQNTIGTDAVPKLNKGLDSFATTSGQVRGLLAAVGPAVDQTTKVLDQLDTTLGQTSTQLDGTRGLLKTTGGTLDTITTDLNAADSAGELTAMRDQLGANSGAIADFMGSPVTLETKPVYPVSNYGSAVAPFYTNLALWVGGFVLIAIYKLEVDREGVGRFGATQAYLGRGLLLVTVGLAQAFIVCVGDLVLRIQCAHPVAFVLSGMVISFVFVNLIYALAIAFKHIGKALAVILVIMQIPGASGLYPIEMMPAFFQRLHPFLPFTYGINMMRGAIAGTYGNHFWVNLGHLALFLPAAWLIGIVARPHLLNLNALFDRRLGETELMVAETPSLGRERLKLTNVIRTLMGSTGYRDRLFRRIRQFDRLYPRLVRAGVIAIAVVPLVFLVLMFSMEAKIVLLTLWVGSIVALCVFLIVVEYVHSTYERDLKISGMRMEEFRQAVLERLDHAAAAAPAGGVADKGADDAVIDDDAAHDDAAAAGDGEAAHDARPADGAPAPDATESGEAEGGEAR